MFKSISLFILTLIIAFLPFAGSANASEPDTMNLKGKWHGQIVDDSAFRISARIDGRTIKVWFIADDMRSLFWKGTVVKGAKLSEGQSFVSRGDRSAMINQMLGSHSRTKRFTLVDGKLQFGQSVLDGTKHIESIEKNHA